MAEVWTGVGYGEMPNSVVVRAMYGYGCLRSGVVPDEYPGGDAERPVESYVRWE